VGHSRCATHAGGRSFCERRREVCDGRRIRGGTDASEHPRNCAGFRAGRRASGQGNREQCRDHGSTAGGCWRVACGWWRSRGRPIVHVARDLGVSSVVLRERVHQAEADRGDRPARLSSSEREKLRSLRREVAQLRRANAILKDAKLRISQRSSIRPAKDDRLYRVTGSTFGPSRCAGHCACRPARITRAWPDRRRRALSATPSRSQTSTPPARGTAPSMASEKRGKELGRRGVTDAAARLMRAAGGMVSSAAANGARPRRMRPPPSGA
jgi:transposase